MFDTILLKILFPLKLAVISSIYPEMPFTMTEVLQGLFLFYSELHPGRKCLYSTAAVKTSQ